MGAAPSAGDSGAALDSEFQQVFQTVLTIRWGDMDAYGHVNNSMYFVYMDQLRILWLESLGLQRPVGQGPAVVNAFMNYRRQLIYPADIICTLYAKPPGRSSMNTRFDVRRQDQPDVVVSDGGATVVWTDYALGQSVPLPDALRARLPAPLA
ncbi:acyl-CoA thioesterase [Robbsia andropogonis]|nr:acyl-CoA thioesterase [Robbsia andropogonis]MCP1119823.1 acyl-CoA thioesterase [Robbsia andropogonis]MCP1128856.1 acyl-CoA thioesterase [Robbsia andropogonis]